MKYILCRPRGGLNDTLCEIGRCHKYAVKTGRKLIVDTSKSGLHDGFWKYFLPASDAFHSERHPDFDALSTYPKSVEGRVTSYVARYDPGIQNYVNETFALLRIDENVDYEEDLLVHEQCWYGEFMSLETVANIKFRPGVAKAILERLSSMNWYDAIHIRNTDYKTDYKEYFKEIYNSVCGRTLLVCSDDYQAIEFAKAFFDQTRVVRLSKFADNEGKPLHGEKTINQFETNMDMFTDLIGLVLAENLYILPVENNTRFSGFSSLAVSIKQRPDIVRGLLGWNQRLDERFDFLAVLADLRKASALG